ncbi:hypothetical protein ACFE04_030721 [Oxalis oulophora]
MIGASNALVQPRLRSLNFPNPNNIIDLAKLRVSEAKIDKLNDALFIHVTSFDWSINKFGIVKAYKRSSKNVMMVQGLMVGLLDENERCRYMFWFHERPNR